MKLVSYVNNGVEWGIIVHDSVGQKDYIIDPEKAQQFIYKFCSDRTVGYFINSPVFFENEIPCTMVDFLETGNSGMETASRMKIFIERFIVQSDRSILDFAAVPVDDAEFLAPVPEPRLLWGLVGNSPSFARGKWEVKQLQLVPQGHHRPLGTVIAHNTITSVYKSCGGNAELAFVIGKKGKHIKMTEAMEYVAGYTIVNDMSQNLYANLIKDMKNNEKCSDLSMEEMGKLAGQTGSFFADEDIFAILSASWACKYSDRMCAIGPYIVTPDEVGDPYDLYIHTSKNDEKLGDGHTCALLVGIERAIAYYSSFATLYPGDIIHLGTVGKDGYSFRSPNAESISSIKCKIEPLGPLTSQFSFVDKEAEGKMPPVKRQVEKLENITNSTILKDIKLRNVYTIYGNSSRNWDGGELKPKPFPRFLCSPGSSLGVGGSKTEVYSTSIKISAEMCAVIGQTIRGIGKQEVQSAVVGYCPMVCVQDYSMMTQLQKNSIAFEREWALPEVYSRWGDGYNIISEEIIIPEELARSNKIALNVEDLMENYNTADYVLWFDDVIAFVAKYITLYPGDIVTLGMLGPEIDLAGVLSKTTSVTMSMVCGGINLSNELIIKQLN